MTVETALQVFIDEVNDEYYTDYSIEYTLTEEDLIEYDKPHSNLQPIKRCWCQV